VTDLPPDAVAHLYPVLVIIGVCFSGLAALLFGLWSGFRWLKGQIRETAQELVTPLAERVAVVERTAAKAHERIDEWLGARQ
jgi:hypothetical protein